MAKEERLLNDDLIKGEYNPAGKSDYLRLEVTHTLVLNTQVFNTSIE